MKKQEAGDVAFAVGATIGIVLLYVLLFVGAVLLMGAALMVGLALLHAGFPSVPPLGFWTSVEVAVGLGLIVWFIKVLLR